MNLVFVYGTLKRGASNHRHLIGQAFVGSARTAPGYRLFKLEGYPGMVIDANDRLGVEGEVWSVDDVWQQHLDKFEGVPEGHYRRQPVSLMAPYADRVVEAYVYSLGVTGRVEVGPVWTE